jgi:protein gp37
VRLRWAIRTQTQDEISPPRNHIGGHNIRNIIGTPVQPMRSAVGCATEECTVAKNSRIEWTTHTFNPWWGCVKMSPACKHCYAESWAKRVGQDIWGVSADRRFFGDKHWSEPLKWDREAAAEGTRARVFCASMADVFEDRPDLDDARERLWRLIESTPHLDWLLLTKRPDLIQDKVNWTSGWPENVWMGTTAEDQKWAKKRLPYLVKVPAAVRFISAEPLLGPLSIQPWLKDGLDWVITGGESGARARPSSPSWFRDLMNQCMEADVAFHFKQWGDWAPGQGINLAKVRAEVVADGTTMLRLGKKNAGRTLDGEIWDGLPKRAA